MSGLEDSEGAEIGEERFALRWGIRTIAAQVVGAAQRTGETLRIVALDTGGEDRRALSRSLLKLSGGSLT